MVGEIINGSAGRFREHLLSSKPLCCLLSHPSIKLLFNSTAILTVEMSKLDLVLPNLETLSKRLKMHLSGTFFEEC